MNRDAFGAKDVNEDVYFDGDVLEKLNKQKAANGKTEEMKDDNNIDLMDFISKSDFSTVGGINN